MILIKHDVLGDLERAGYSFVTSDQFTFPEGMWASFATWRRAWEDLPADVYLTDGGSYRFRRHGRFSFCPAKDEMSRLPEGAYFQSAEVNRFAGDIPRKFAPLSEETFCNPLLHEIIRLNFKCFPLTPECAARPWTVDVHLVRVRATRLELGKPTPEGIHCDGFKYVSFHMIDRQNVVGGVSEIYDNNKQLLRARPLIDLFDSCYADDTRIMHATTPIAPHAEGIGWRDMLLMSYH
jgi:hypothetical protein